MQKTSGIHSFLNLSVSYNFVQKIFSHQETEAFVKTHSNVGTDAVVIDIGCGTGNILSSINNQYEYFGFDISDDYISAARLRYKDREKTNFFLGKFDDESSKKLPKADLAMLLGVMHHLGEIELRTLLNCLSGRLKKGSKLITVDPVIFKGQNFLANALVKMDRGKSVRSASGYLNFLCKDFNIVNSETIGQTFPPYDRFVSVSVPK